MYNRQSPKSKWVTRLDDQQRTLQSTQSRNSGAAAAVLPWSCASSRREDGPLLMRGPPRPAQPLSPQTLHRRPCGRRKPLAGQLSRRLARMPRPNGLSGSRIRTVRSKSSRPPCRRPPPRSWRCPSSILGPSSRPPDHVCCTPYAAPIAMPPPPWLPALPGNTHHLVEPHASLLRAAPLSEHLPSERAEARSLDLHVASSVPTIPSSTPGAPWRAE